MYKHYIPTTLVKAKVYEAAGSITTPTQTLPAGRVWANAELVMDPLAPGASYSIDILTAAGAPVAGYQKLASGASLTALAATDVKARVNLTAGAGTTPVIRGLRLNTMATPPIARTTSITIPGAGANDRIIIDSFQFNQAANSGTIDYQFADSADNVSFSAFQSGYNTISRRFIKWQILPTVSGSTNSVMASPVVRRVQINYHY
jgi:hypothetical protein